MSIRRTRATASDSMQLKRHLSFRVIKKRYRVLNDSKRDLRIPANLKSSGARAIVTLRRAARPESENSERRESNGGNSPLIDQLARNARRLHNNVIPRARRKWRRRSSASMRAPRARLERAEASRESGRSILRLRRGEGRRAAHGGIRRDWPRPARAVGGRGEARVRDLSQVV